MAGPFDTKEEAEHLLATTTTAHPPAKVEKKDNGFYVVLDKTAAKDIHGNEKALEGVDRCSCGSKYWENDTCVSCGAPFREDPFEDEHRFSSKTASPMISGGSVEIDERANVARVTSPFSAYVLNSDDDRTGERVMVVPGTYPLAAFAPADPSVGIRSPFVAINIPSGIVAEVDEADLYWSDWTDEVEEDWEPLGRAYVGGLDQVLAEMEVCQWCGLPGFHLVPGPLPAAGYHAECLAEAQASSRSTKELVMPRLFGPPVTASISDGELHLRYPDSVNYRVRKLNTPGIEEYGIWSESAQEYVAESTDVHKLMDSADRWNQNPAGAPDNFVNDWTGLF
jgi:hypothetical protein